LVFIIEGAGVICKGHIRSRTIDTEATLLQDPLFSRDLDSDVWYANTATRVLRSLLLTGP
jgi:hypothetical protein